MLDNSFGAGKHAFALSTNYATRGKYLLDKLGRKIWKFNLRQSIINEKHVLEASLINLYHYETKSNLWSCNAEIELKVTNRSGETVTRTIEYCFTNRSARVNFDRILFRNVVSPEDEDEDDRDENNLFVVNIKIKKLVGIRPIRFSNFASSQELDPPNSEVTLVVGDHTLYVDKFGLMGCSSVFCEMFHNDIYKKGLGIHGVSIANFLAFIRLIYKQEQQITLENVKILLELAVTFGVAFLIEDCVQFMVETEKIGISEKNRLAVKHKLVALEEDALKRQQALHVDIVKILEPLKKQAADQLKDFEEAKAEYKNFEQELERMAGEAEERLELVKILQTAKPLNPREQQIFSAFQARSPKKPPFYYRRSNGAAKSIWKEIKEQNTDSCQGGPVAKKMKKEISSKFDDIKDNVVQQHRTFWDFVKVMHSGQAHEMLEHIRKEEIKK